MNIKKTGSLVIGDDGNRSVKHESERPQSVNPNFGIQSQNALASTIRRRFRVPQAMQEALRQSNQLPPLVKNKSDDVQIKESMKTSKIGSVIRSKIQGIRNITICQICESEMKHGDKQQLYLCECQHKFNFCESCLHHYVIFKVKTFEEVACPREDCRTLIDTNALFFKQLPIDIQKNYRKIHQFYQTANDPNKKLCPKQSCEGIISNVTEGVMVCNTCESQFCGKCLLAKHDGLCDQHQVEFFQNNLHYRQCKRCKFVIEKNQGCNHMTCRCGYQFCYVCTADWAPAHYGNHDQNGNLIVGAVDGAAYVPPPPEEPCCDCGCCQQMCGQTVACILKAPFKFVLIILFTFLMLCIFVTRDLFVIFGMLLVTIITGLFGFSCQVLSNLEGICCVLGVIFFPITMLAGIGMAFKQVFCDVIPDLCGDYWTMCCDGYTSVCQI